LILKNTEERSANEEGMKAVIVGSANTDLIIQVDELPPPGDTGLGRDFRSGPGGKGANQAVCLSRLGVETHLIARFGGDGFSSLLREAIESHGVDLSASIIDGERMGGVVFIIVDRDGNNTMVADLGTNLSLCGDDIQEARALFEKADFLLLQFEVPDEANLRACELARQNGMSIVINPAPMRKFAAGLIEAADLITPNVQELSELLEHTEGKRIIEADERNLGRIAEAASRLITHGIRDVIVTVGRRGCVHVSEKQRRMYGSFNVKQVDSTAAGDAFTAALALRYSETGSLDESVPFAAAAAAITVTRPGAIPSLPDRHEVEEFMKNNRMAGLHNG
jgi:ribokinase